MATHTSDWRDRLRPAPATARWALIVVNAELLVLWLWYLTTQPQFNSLLGVRYVLYPFVWINVGLWALVRTTPTPALSRRRALAGVLAAGYFLVLAYVGGLVGAGTHHTVAPSVALGTPPGFSPAVLYDGGLLKLTLIPYKLIGYLALAYLVYVTVIDAAGSAVTGVLGLFSCISCTWPIIAAAVTGTIGGGAAIAGAVYAGGYDLSVAVFVLTVGLLYWRPTR
ncbi:DUF7546 family protein [Halapricum desulfuricans]|uniref:Putative membrane protein n=1 Tax=Halapricum desulfuricans TaxID=2841257 RepID=A0A897NTZ7_9EURY|nr:hypothetical protein [Halapricum desulfuricans]QSG14995.1 putative membrane protein [Halapricum desulfuricans]